MIHAVIRYELPLTYPPKKGREKEKDSREREAPQKNTKQKTTRRRRRRDGRADGRHQSANNQQINRHRSSADIIEIPLPISSPPKYLVVLLPLTTRDASLRTTSRVSCCPPTIIDRRSSIVPAGQAIITSVAHRPHDSKYDDKR